MKITQVVKAAATAGALALLMAGSAGAVTLNTMNGSEPGSIDPHRHPATGKTGSSATTSKAWSLKTPRPTPSPARPSPGTFPKMAWSIRSTCATVSSGATARR